jgi:hypothetical protein
LCNYLFFLSPRLPSPAFIFYPPSALTLLSLLLFSSALLRCPAIASPRLIVSLFVVFISRTLSPPTTSPPLLALSPPLFASSPRQSNYTSFPSPSLHHFSTPLSPFRSLPPPSPSLQLRVSFLSSPLPFFSLLSSSLLVCLSFPYRCPPSSRSLFPCHSSQHPHSTAPITTFTTLSQHRTPSPHALLPRNLASATSSTPLSPHTCTPPLALLRFLLPHRLKPYFLLPVPQNHTTSTTPLPLTSPPTHAPVSCLASATCRLSARARHAGSRGTPQCKIG